MIEIGTASGLLAASIACAERDAVARSTVTCCVFDNSFSANSLANASACLGGLRGAPPPRSG